MLTFFIWGLGGLFVCSTVYYLALAIDAPEQGRRAQRAYVTALAQLSDESLLATLRESLVGTTLDRTPSGVELFGTNDLSARRVHELLGLAYGEACHADPAPPEVRRFYYDSRLPLVRAELDRRLGIPPLESVVRPHDDSPPGGPQ